VSRTFQFRPNLPSVMLEIQSCSERSAPEDKRAEIHAASRSGYVDVLFLKATSPHQVPGGS
jgi:hypothetical protein